MKLVIFYLFIFFSIPSFVKGLDQAQLDHLQKSIGDKTVYIESLKGGEWDKGQGFMITHDGFLLTAKHLIEGAQEIFGSWIDSSGEEHVKNLMTMSMHPQFDLALLKVSAPKNEVFSCFEFDVQPLDIHQWIFLGFYDIKDKRFTIRGGKIMYIEYSNTLQTAPQGYVSFSSSSEDDGGPCFQIDGKIVGVFLGSKTIHVEFAKFLPYLEFKNWLEKQLNTFKSGKNKK